MYVPGRSLTRRSVAFALALYSTGCGPEIPFTWQVVDVLDLGMNVEVEELGPLSSPADPEGRPFQESMPLDQVRASVMVADIGGPVPLEDLSFAWFACNGPACESSLDTPPCPDEGVQSEACALGTAPSMTFQFAEPDTPEQGLQTLTNGRILVRAIGGLSDDPGPRACLERLETGADLGRCLIVDGVAQLGSLGELLALYESRGGTLPEDPLLDIQRQFPRNRVPSANEVLLRREGATSATRVSADAPIEAVVGEVLNFEWRPTEADLEEITVVASDGTSLANFDVFTDAWWTTQRATEFDDTGPSRGVRWVVGPDTGTFTLYTVVRDDSDATDWASFTVEVSR